MKKLIQLLFLLTSVVSFSQYNSSGVFKKVATSEPLTSGYYVITDRNSEKLMTSNYQGTYLVSINVQLTNFNIKDPSSHHVWKINPNNGGITLYNEETEEYLAYFGGGNSIDIDTTVNNSSTWIQNLNSDVISLHNKQTPNRKLAYNIGYPRFAAYTAINTNQIELQAYKLIAPFSEKKFCGVTTVAALTGPAQFYKWYTSSVGGQALSPSDVIETGIYYVSTVFDGIESVRTQVSIINEIVPEPEVSAQMFCGSANVSNLPQGNGTYRWYTSLSSVTSLQNSNVLETRTYYVSAVGIDCESSRVAVPVTINEIPAIPTVTSQVFCGSASVSDLPQGNGSYKWYSNYIGGEQFLNTQPLATGFYYVSQTISGCESGRTLVNVLINSIPEAPTVNSQTFCGSATIADLPQGNGTFKWYDSLTGDEVLTNNQILSSGNYYVSTTISGCESARTEVAVTIHPIPAVPTVLSQEFCGSATVADLPQGNGLYKWYTTLTSTSALSSTEVLSSTTYYVSALENGCESDKIAVVVTIYPIPVAPVVSTQVFCGSATVANLPQDNGTYKWYSTLTSVSALSNTDALTSENYYVSTTVNGCESARTAVVVIINEIPVTPVVSTQVFCGSATVADLPQGNGSYKWYASLESVSALTSTVQLTNDTYYVSAIANGCESEKIAVTVVINEIPVVPSVSSQVFCGSATVGDLPQGNGSYKWYTTLSSEVALSNTDNLISGTYYVSAIANGCESTKTPVVITIYPIPVAPVVPSQEFCGSATVADLPQGNGTYKWYATSTSESILGNTFGLTNGTYYVTTTINGCESAKTIVEVIINPIPAVAVVPSQVFCGSATVADLPQGNGTYKWYATLTSSSALTSSVELSNNNYFVSVIDNGCESARVAVSVTIYPIPVAPVVSSQEFCGSATVLDLPQGNGTYKWYATPTSVSVLLNSDELSNGTYFVSTTENGCESGRTEVTVTIYPIPAIPTVPSQEFCGSATVGDLPRGNETYKWYATLSSTTALLNTQSLASGNYYVSTTENGCESARTEVVVTVHPIPAIPTVPSQVFCGSATVLDLPQGNGLYKWFTTLASTSALSDTDNLSSTTYYVASIANGCESPRVAVAVTINEIPEVPTVAAQLFCGNATVADLPQGNGTYKWYTTLTSTSALATSVELTNETYYVSTTVSGCESARTAVSVTVNPILPVPVVPSQVFCGSATVADLPQGNETYKWYTTLTSTTALTSETALVTQTYYVSALTNDCESDRIAVSVTINPIPDAPVVPSQVFCGSATVAELPQGNGTYKWYATSTSDAVLLNSAELSNATYYVSTTVNGCESARVAVVVTINPIPVAPTVASQVFCGNTTVADLPQGNGTYKWYTSLTSVSALSNTDVLTSDNYYVSTTLLGCESVRVAVSVTINTIPAVPTVPSQVFCGSATVADLPQGNGTYKWYATSTSTSALSNSDVLEAGNYYVSAITNGCESARVAVSVTINEVPVAPTVVAQVFCGSATVLDLPQGNGTFKWYANLSSTTVLLNSEILAGGTYYVSTTVNGCESLRTAVSVTINEIPAAPSVVAQVFCGSATVLDLPQVSGSYKWYNVLSGGVALSTSQSLTSGTYYVSTTVNGCESARAAVVVTINPTPAVPTVVAQVFCGSATVLDLPQGNGTHKWYAGSTGGLVLSNSQSLTSGTYYVSTTVNGCESARVAVTVTINPVPVAPVVSPQTFCGSAMVNALPQGDGTYQWYASLNSVNVLSNTSSLSTGIYYVSITVNGCESVRKPVSVTVNPIPAAPTVASQFFCGNTTVSMLSQGNPSYKWYSNQTGGLALSNSAFITSGTYYVSIRVNGCESARTAVQVVVTPTPTTPIVTEQTLCGGAVVSNLPQGNGAYKWYSSLTSLTALSNTAVLTSGTYYVSRWVSGCESERAQVVVNIIELSPVNANSLQTFCGTATVADLQADGMPGAEILWYSSIYQVTPLPLNTPLAVGTYYVQQRVGGCYSVKKPVSVNISSLNAPIVNGFTFCEGATVDDLIIYAESGTTFRWYSSMTSTQVLPGSTVLVSGAYYVAKVKYGCESQRAQVNVVVKNLPNMPTGETTQTYMEGSVINHLIVHPITAVWFITEEDAATLTNPLSPNMPLIQGLTYYAVNIGTNGCPSLPLAVTVNVILSNEDFVKDEIKVFPNPVVDYLKITNSEVIDEVTIFNVLGQNVFSRSYSENDLNIDFTSFTSGTYFVKIQTNSGIKTIKILKK